MATKDEILEQLTLAEEHIANAKVMVNDGPEPPPEYVPVNPGDNIMQLIQDNPENTLFAVHNDFIQNIGQTTFPKPCTLKSERGKLITCLTVKPNTHFIGMMLDGANSNTILTAADGTTVDASTLTGGVSGQHRGIAANCKGVRIRNSRIVNIFKDQDTQAVSGWDGTDDLEITGNYLEASGENIMFGGADSSSEQNMPRNILIENNFLTKKIEWRASPLASCKNLIELKAVTNIIIRKNEMEYSFVDGQIGYAVVFSVRNQEGNAPWSTVKNVLYEENITRHTAGGLSILGRDDTPGHVSTVMSNVMVRKNQFLDINSAFGGNGRQVFISGGPDALTLDGNEFQCTTNPNSALSFDQPQNLVTNLVIQNQVLFIEGSYGIFGTNAPGLGTPVLNMYAPGYVWQNNNVHKSGIRNIPWPAGTNFV